MPEQVDKRQTGRTTRMLEEALYQARVQGRAVYVVMPYENLRELYASNPKYHCLRFETLHSLRTLDLRTGRLVGAHPNCLVFVDHSVLEMHFSWLVAQSTRFDAPAAETK